MLQGWDFQKSRVRLAHWQPGCTFEDHRIIESVRLEKTSKIMKSNRQPNTTMSAKPCPEIPDSNAVRHKETKY